MPKLTTTRARAPLGATTTKDRRNPPAPPATSDYVSRPRRDWSTYNDELRDRPVRTLEVIVDTASTSQWRPRLGRIGRPAYSQAAITACYMLRAVFHLNLRATEGLVRSILASAGLDPSLAPDYSTLCRARDRVTLRSPRAVSPVALIDGTGFSFLTHGPWIQHKWREQRLASHRFVRVTLTTDAATGAVIASVVTPESGEGTGETSQFDELAGTATGLGATTMIGDGAYDTKHCYEVSNTHGLRLITPPQVNAVFGLHPDRDVTLAQVNRLGTAEWKRRVKYHQRSRVESDIGAAKLCFTDRVRSRSFEGAKAEVLAALSVLNLWRVGTAGLAAT